MASKKEDCVICRKGFVDGTDKVEVGKKGLAFLLEFSKKKDKSDLYDYLTSIANSENCKIKLHKNCTRDYTNKRRSIDLSDKGEDKSPPKRLPSHAAHFDWKTKSFFCAETVDERHPEIPTRTASGKIFNTFEIFRLPPENTIILLSDGGKRMPTKSQCGCQVCVKA